MAGGGRLTTHVLDTAWAGRRGARDRALPDRRRRAPAPQDRHDQRRRPLRRSRCWRARSCAGALRAGVPGRATICGRTASRCPTRRSSTSCRSASASPSRRRTTTCRCWSRPSAIRPIGAADAVRTHAIRFLLGRRGRASSSGVDPTLTVLDYLRYDRRRTGTKEGCAEGDCGACTVVLGELDGDGAALSRRSTPASCFVPTLDGSAAVHGRGPARPTATLHPVQQAMVDVPRLAMRLLHAGLRDVALRAYQRSARRSRRRGESTTRSPAISAAAPATARSSTPAQAMRATPAARLDRRRWPRAGARSQRRARRDAGVEREGRRFLAPAHRSTSWRGAARRTPTRRSLAGGTDVGLWVTKQHARSRRPSSTLGQVRGAAAHRETRRRDRDRRRRHATPRRTRRSPALHPRLRRAAAAASARLQVRNCGTIGGNIANGSPIGDTPPRADRARRAARAAPRRRAARSCRWRISSRLRQAGPAAGRVRRGVRSSRSPRAGDALPRLQDLQALRPGHLRRLRGASDRRSTAAASPTRASPSAAWRRRRSAPRAAEAALIGQPWTEATRRGRRRGAGAGLHAARPTCAPRPPIALQAAQNLLLRASGSRRGQGAADPGARRREAAGPWLTPATALSTPRRRPPARIAHDSAAQACRRRGALYRRHAGAARALLHAARRPGDRARTRGSRALDLDAVRAAPGVVGVLTAADMPGRQRRRPGRPHDEPMLRRRASSVRRPAAVRGRRRDAAPGARAPPRWPMVEYEDLPALLDVDAARAGRQLADRAAMPMRRGDAARRASPRAPHRARRAASHVGGQEHFYLEGQVALRRAAARTATCTSTPRPSTRARCSTWSRMRSACRATPSPSRCRRMGGGFGGKETQAGHCRRARRARRAQDRPAGQAPARPRRRHDRDRQAPRLRVDYEVGFDDDGRILGVELDARRALRLLGRPVRRR